MIPFRLCAYAACALALAGCLWWAYSTVWQRGYDVARDKGDKALAQYKAEIEVDRAESVRQARAAEDAYRLQVSAIARQLEQEKDNAQAIADRTADDLRAGNLQLRRHWQGCIAAARVSGDSIAASLVDAAAERRATDSGNLIRAGAECDATVRGLQRYAEAVSR